MQTYRAALIGCSRMGAFIDNEVAADRGAYSHAAGYEVCARTEMVACSDMRTEVMERTGQRYGVPKQRQYLDYREMIEREKPDILSIATQPEHRAEIAIWAAANGVRAIYAEKALCASLAEADAMVAAMEANGVWLNMGTNRRWDPGYDAMKAMIESGELGALQNLVLHSTSSLFNGASHGFDLLMRLNDDAPVAWAQAHLQTHGEVEEGGFLREDPVGHGLIQFANGVMGYALNSGRGLVVEAVCEKGVVTALDNGQEWQVRLADGTAGVFPDFISASSTVGLIDDLVEALDSGRPPRCGVRLAHANTALIFAFIESHQRGGARVELPLESSPYCLQRRRDPRQPKYNR
ncbi:MAG: hypothetical protein GKR89_13090 [Candidatus Latescibacteria bacterium]|nr:hypothetical protein [Candidatus Latescibacterota bacterium]